MHPHWPFGQLMGTFRVALACLWISAGGMVERSASLILLLHDHVVI